VRKLSGRKLEETVVRSETLFIGHLLSVRKDEVRLPNGRTAIREVVEHPGAVVIVPLLDNNTVIMVRQFREPVGRVLLELPAGTLHVGEDPLACASRELLEETGYEAKELEKLIEFFVAPGYSTELIRTYVGRQLVQRAQDTDEDEFIDIVRMPLIKCIDMIRANEIMDAKTICSLAALCLSKCLPCWRATW